jgi:branched-chain amino acid transport system ATP-binding protein
VLRAEGLTVHYGNVPALREISFHVEQGEIVAVLGPNGAGKSTLLNTIAGTLSPSSGTLTVDGQSITGSAPEQNVRRGISLVPEGRHIFGTLTVAENLQLGATTRRDKGEVASDLERTLVRFPALRDAYRRPAGGLSGGQQQQLAIARALLARPRLLLLDEPSLGLSPQMIDLVFDVLEELHQEGLTIVLVEQHTARAVEIADRSYVLRSGRVAMVGDRTELAAKSDFAQEYLGAGSS